MSFLIDHEDDLSINRGFPGGAVIKNPPANVEDIGDVSLIPGLGRSLRVENGNPLQYSCLENCMDRLQSMGSQRFRHN